MRSSTALRLAALTLSLGLSGALAPAAAAAPPPPAPAPGPATPGPAAADYYYDCDNTFEADPDANGPAESVSIMGEGCVARPGDSPAEGIYVEDWGSPEDWVCAQVDPTPGTGIIGHGCRAVPKDSRTADAPAPV
ncbi:hypothetical protein GCM10009801_67280 [Streptomyces albiaxialis]|uniref:Secreted protein n=1 Tax=Streptomyces albiaxialis TaxID=329523 RepID=A0ABN2WT13_9ACTN